ncbi:adenylate/guanylate cyclase domain-containing protein [Aestuariispira ectoiniformans]|uniref:adenylate/guanylate cyclase domain-containing protein n=1 Tax=Aestuariispira ectoiniformans TaxID=2775080 RepID=UPI00223AE2EA|nr:adenylate/guanylate cyclase domain-containing protein [Aestuariispira ectoiniformans]
MRISIRTLLLFGFGGLTLVGIGIILSLGFVTATRNTFSLYAQMSKDFIDTISDEVEAEFNLVQTQGEWMRQAFESGRIQVDDYNALEDFLDGSMAATPAVMGTVLVTDDKRQRRFARQFPHLVLSNVPEKEYDREWKVQFQSAQKAAWSQPVWIEELQETVLNLRTPLTLPDGRRAMIIQVVTVSKLSEILGSLDFEFDSSPFILYGSEYVLAHPKMHADPALRDQAIPLPRVADYSDPILAKFETRQPLDGMSKPRGPNDKRVELRQSKNQKDENVIFVNDQNYEVSIVDVDSQNEQEYVFIHRVINGYSDRPIVVGAYFNNQSTNREIRRLIGSFAVSLGVLVITVGGALFIGRRVGRPIMQLAAAAQKLRDGHLNDVPHVNPSRILELRAAAKAFNAMLNGLREQERMRNLFGKMVPRRVAEQMLNSPAGLAPQSATATVLFCDIKDFTALSEMSQPVEIIDILNAYFTKMVSIIEAHNGIITQFQGDAILAVFNVPLPDEKHAENAIRAALEMLEAVRTETFCGKKLACRIGVNTGPLVAGNVGADSRMNYTVHGDAVNTASRLEQLNKDHGTVLLVSETTQDLAQMPDLTEIGSVTLRGKQKPVRIYTNAPQERT